MLLIKILNIKLEIYESRIVFFIFKIFDLEVFSISKLIGMPDVFVGWSGCVSYCIKHKIGKIKNLVYSGGSHIQRQHDVLLSHANVNMHDFYIKNHLSDYGFADNIIVESMYAKLTFPTVFFDKIKILSVPLNSDLPLDEFRSGLLVDKYVRICFVSTRPAKGFNNFLNIAERLKDNNKFKFDLYADDFRLCSKNTNINILRPMPNQEFISKLSNYDVVLILTLDDGGPRLLVESLSFGTYVVATEFCKAPEFEELGLTSIAINNDVDCFVNILESLDYNKIRATRSIRRSKFNTNVNYDIYKKDILEMIGL